VDKAGETPHTHATMIDVARELAVLIREHARSAEEARQPADEVIDAAVANGLFRMMSPACYGGAELDLDTYFDVGLILGEADASHGWVLDFYIEHVWMLCQFPDAFQKELFADRSFVLAPAMLSPTGRASIVPGGYRLDGRWQWATGIVHGEWVIAGALVTVDEVIRPMFFALPRDEVTVEDTWYVDGMCGTGSHDVVISDRFVPDDQAVDIGHMMNATAPGSELHDGPLYRTPMAPILSFAAALPVLGQARFAATEFARQLVERYEFATLAKQADRSSRQSRLAEAHLTTAAAEALLRSVLAEIIEQRSDADTHTRVRWAAAIAHAVLMCQQAVGSLCEAAGAGSHFLDNPLQRARRDVNTMVCHTVFDAEERNRGLGRSLLGMPAESRWH
jgi:alkylation response protein AidB-like acyl-CoA dehydrogenase